METAVIRTGAKQYRVAAGDVIRVEKLVGNPGDDVVFSEVLAVGDDKMKFGSPLVAKASVKAKIVSQDLGEKLIVFKFKRRKGYRRKNGHRQKYTSVQITSIKG
jgi:large subunit ribosomal protein L21